MKRMNMDITKKTQINLVRNTDEDSAEWQITLDGQVFYEAFIYEGNMARLLHILLSLSHVASYESKTLILKKHSEIKSKQHPHVTFQTFIVVDDALWYSCDTDDIGKHLADIHFLRAILDDSWSD